MTIAFLFWLLMILVLIFGILERTWPACPRGISLSNTVLLWILLFLLGWRAFGFPIQG